MQESTSLVLVYTLHPQAVLASALFSTLLGDVPTEDMARIGAPSIVLLLVVIP